MIQYALFASQPEICHFLLENGAERDFAEPAITWDGSDRDHTKLINEDYHSKGDISERYSFNVHFDRDNEEVNYVGSFSAVSSNIIETDIEHQPCLNYCHLLLLEANADPSITVSSYDASHIRGTLSVGTAVRSQQLMLDSGTNYITSNLYDNFSTSGYIIASGRMSSIVVNGFNIICNLIDGHMNPWTCFFLDKALTGFHFRNSSYAYILRCGDLIMPPF